MKREYMVFICALACLLAIPFLIAFLTRRFGRTLDEERRTRAILYLCADVMLVMTIFGFWLLG